MSPDAIPYSWIRNYIDFLLKAAEGFGPDSAMGKAAMLRAEHAMDLVEAHQKDKEKSE